MWQQIKVDFQRRPKLFIGAFALMGLLLLAALWQLRPYLPAVWPGRAQIAAEAEAVAQAHRDLQVRIDRAYELIRNQESLLDRSDEFWLASRDGNVELEPQKMIEEAAEKAGLQLTSVGNVQGENIGEIGQRMYLTVSAQSSISTIVDFISEIEARRPRLFWRNLTLRPDNIRTYGNVVFNGTLEFIFITDEDTAALLTENQS
jgi:hypothetical protein